MKTKALKNNKQGFALLFSVLISSLMLTIGLSIFGIALKELAISTAARQSVHAFFAADSGRECLIYWDIKKGAIPTLIDTKITGSIYCGGSLYSFTIDEGSTGYDSIMGPKTTKIPPVAAPAQFARVDSSTEANFVVEMKKSRATNDPKKPIITTVTSRGYDSTASGDRVERAIQQTY
jgi:hypothetical protein